MATPTLLDQRGLEGGADVAKLPEAEQRALVAAILRREMGVMATSARAIVARARAARAPTGWSLGAL